MCKASRDILKDMFGEEVSSKVRILYGGSMNPSNVKELIAQEDIDGGLVGGASLKAQDFAELIKNAVS
jgi:triosephosphate isomerase